MLYHPDKHRDPELKIQAEQLFNQVHQAYEGKDTFKSYTNWDKNVLLQHLCKQIKQYSSGTGHENGQNAMHNAKILKEKQQRLHKLNSFFPLPPSVLSDEHSRAIYDIFGKKGLEVEGWEVFILSNTTISVLV